MNVNKDFIKQLNVNATVIAATKYVSKEVCLDLFNLGVTNFGENRTDSFLEKYEYLKDKSITWHFIGKLQSKKVKDVINKIDFLHSLDRFSLADEIEKRAEKTIKCFVEVNSGEEQKDGVSYNQFASFYEVLKKYSKIEIVGLMTMAKDNASELELEDTFNKLASLAKEYNLPFLSMGMSNDYKVALKCGATHIRLGRVLFE